MAIRRACFATTARRFTSSAELDALRILIREHDHAYYVLGTPSATDAEYDALFDSLRRTEAADPSLPVPPESPTQRVGGGLMDEAGDRARGVPHHAPMLSLESVRAEDRAETVERWSARVVKAMAAHDPSLIDDDADDDAQLKLAFAVEPKIDGVAVSLLYEEGKLVRALTRGDGVVGDDITASVRAIKTVPLLLRGDPPRELEVRGEVYIGSAAFAAMNAAREDDSHENPNPLRAFTSPRNAAAGALRSLSVDAASKWLSLNCYHSAAPWGARALPATHATRHSAMLNVLRDWGLPVPALSLASDAVVATLDEILDRCAAMESQRADVPFDIDGCVVKLDLIAAQLALGATSRAPRWALALKFEPHEALTVVREIELRISRFGTATPVARLEPVLLAGATITSASLHNFDELRRKDVRVGDVVRVRRAGDVIPEVIGPLVERRDATNPPPRYTLDGDSLDANFVAQEVQVMRLSHASSKSVFGIDGVGKQLVRSLVESGAARHVADLFLIGEIDFREEGDAVVDVNADEFGSDRARRLSRLRTHLNEMRGMGPKKLAKLQRAIGAAKRAPPMARLLLALGIKGVGATVAKKLDAACGGDIATLVRAVVEKKRADKEAAAAEAVDDDDDVEANANADEENEGAEEDAVAISPLAVAGVGPVVSEALDAFCGDADAVSELLLLFDAGVVPHGTDVDGLVAALAEHKKEQHY